MLYPGNGKPLFEQLRELIVNKITSGEYKPGEKLPSERALSEMYNISRLTVRLALSDLVNDGMLIKKQGKGTFVANKPIQHSLGGLIGAVEELAHIHVDMEVRILKKEICSVSAEILRKMNNKLDKTMLLISRLVIVDGVPLALDYAYLPNSVAHFMDNVDLTKDVIYLVLEKCGFKITTAVQTIGAENPLREEAELLGIKTTAPVLALDRITSVEGDIPILYSKTIYRADRYQYNMSLKRHNKLS